MHWRLVALTVLVNFCGSHYSKGEQQSFVPQHLSSKYGSLQVNPGGYGAGVKTGFGSVGIGGGTKTSYTKTKTQGGPDESSGYASSFVKQTVYKGGCTSQPQTPVNSKMRCSHYDSGCRVTCLPSFQFPNGQTQLFLTCQDGEWQVVGTEWENVPACEPICSPPCLNNGICMAPNECNCPENFSGSQCEFESVPCLNHPPMPINAKRTCSSSKCTITCMKGHKFPDGSAIATMTCKGGSWVPTKEQWVTIPDCQATCTPPCQNGGNCLSFNVCQCPQEFRGPQCQYSASLCSARNLQFNGGYNCSGSGDSFSCSVSCPAGIEFEFPPAHLYTCTYASGQFLPQPIPQCVFGTDVNVIPLGGHSHSYYEGGSGSFSTGSMSVNGSKFHPEGFGYETDSKTHPYKPILRCQGHYEQKKRPRLLVYKPRALARGVYNNRGRLTPNAHGSFNFLCPTS